MLYVHEKNLLGKLKNSPQNKYFHLQNEIQNFYNTEYLPTKNRLLSLNFSKNNKADFVAAANMFNDYYNKLNQFSRQYSITSQSKFESTFLEEISSYLFKDITEIQNGEFGVFNKGIYAGLKINSNRKVEVIKKDVDFCIGKKVNISLDNQVSTELIIPIIAVEVKTYLDATMFGEVKSSSKSIRNASPNSKTYVLMGYKSIADEHIISARQDSALSEIFVLRANAHAPIDSNVLYDYWEEITNSISQIANDNLIQVPGRLLNP